MGKGKHGHTGEHGKSHGHGKGGSESHKDGHGHENNHTHPTAATTSTSNEVYLQSPDPTIINTSPQGSITSITNRRGKPSRMTQKIEERRLVDSPPDKMSNFVQSLRGLNSGPNTARSSSKTPRLPSKSPRPTASTSNGTQSTGKARTELLPNEELVMQVKVVNCKNLMDADAKGSDRKTGLSDPYVTLTIGSEVVQTQRHDNTLNPCFNETHIMTWDGKNDLVCAVFDHDVHSSDDNLGKLTIPLTNFDWLSGKVFNLHDIPLTNTDRGTISLEISELGSLAGVERGLKLHREMMLCPACGGTGQVSKTDGLPNGHRTWDDRRTLKELGYGPGHLIDSDPGTISQIAGTIDQITKELDITWFLNGGMEHVEKSKTLVSDVHGGLNAVWQHCRKLKNRNERNEQEIKKQNERLVEEKNEFQNELSDMKNRFFEHQCDITGKLEEKSELVHTLNVDLKKYVSQIADMKEKLGTATDENKQLKFDVDRLSRQVLEFPRREEEILRDAEKMLRLRSATYRLEDAKMKSQMQELKQLGFWKSRVEKLEKENKSLRHEIKNAKRQHAMQTSLFIKRRSATTNTGTTEDNARNETVSPSHPQSPAGYMPSSNQETTLMGGDEDEDDHSNMSDQQIIKYQKIQLQNASARQEELIQRISHLSNALANARAYPLLQTRVDDRDEYPDLFKDDDHHHHEHGHHNAHKHMQQHQNVLEYEEELEEEEEDDTSVDIGLDFEEARQVKEMTKSRNLTEYFARKTKKQSQSQGEMKPKERMVMEARANLRNRTDNIFSKRVNDDPKRSAKNNFVI